QAAPRPCASRGCAPEVCRVILGRTRCEAGYPPRGRSLLLPVRSALRAALTAPVRPNTRAMYQSLSRERPYYSADLIWGAEQRRCGRGHTVFDVARDVLLALFGLAP